MYIFLKNSIVKDSEAVVSVYDHGFLYGDGIYETVRCYQGVVFMFDRHIERLHRSASFIKLKLPDENAIRTAVSRTLAANNLLDAYIRMTVSRGEGPIGLDPDLCKEPTFVVIAEQFRAYPARFYGEGMRLVIAKTKRNLREAVDPRIKSLNFLNNVLAKIEAKEREADEAIMLNSEGFLAEGTVSNIFFVRGNVLCTPSPEAGILDGITREVVICLAKKQGMKVEEGLYRAGDLVGASEVFLTNTSGEVVPVSMVDDTRYRPGEVSRRLHSLYGEEVAAYIKREKR